MAPHRAGLGIAIALVAAVFYGIVPITARDAFLNGVPAVDTVFFRTGIVALGLAIIALIRRDSLRLPKEARAAFLGQAIATLCVSVGYIASVQFIPVSLAVIIFYTFPVLIMLSAPMVEGHAPGILRIFIALVAFIGLAISVGPTFEDLDWRGIVLAAAAAIGCTLQFFSGRALSRKMMPASFGSLVHLAILPLTLLISLWVGSGAVTTLSHGAATTAGILAMIATSLLYVGGYMSHMLSLRFAPASTVAPFYNLEPVIATVAAALVLGERMAFSQYVGGALILAALVASGFVGAKKNPV